jgi:hypothetical protein
LKVCGLLRQVRFKFEPGSLNGFSEIDVRLNLGLNFRSGSGKVLNFELNFGPVLRSSGSNFGSGPNLGIMIHYQRNDSEFFESMVASFALEFLELLDTSKTPNNSTWDISSANRMSIIIYGLGFISVNACYRAYGREMVCF